MPGIAGIFAKQISVGAPKLLETMLKSMMHETFYIQALNVYEEHGWFCGSVAIKGSFADGMPLLNETRNVIMFFSGECFNDNQAITELRSKGQTINFNPANHLVYLYEKEGPDFVKKLNGWFSGVILDIRRAKAFLFNDRYSMQRVYYYEDSSAFYFASEAKALLRVIPSLRAAELKSMAEYLCFDCVLEERTYFRGVNVLPGGALWVFNGKSVERKSYFDLNQQISEPSSDTEDFLEQLTSTFKHLLPRYLIGNRIAIALTGGLDTRLIMACLPRDCHHVTTLTFGGMYRDSMDLLLAREVSESCNIRHDTIRLGTDFLSDYPEHAARAVYMTDGLADATNVDSIYLSSCARRLAPIILMGAFGSQVLGRVRRALRYRPPAPELVSTDFKPYIDEASKALEPFRQENNLIYILKREIPWYWSRFTIPQMLQLTYRSPFLDNDFVNLLYCAPSKGFDGSKFELAAISKNKPELLDILTNKGVGGKAPAPISIFIQMIMRGRSLAEKALNGNVLPCSLHHAVTRADSLIISPLHIKKLVLGYENFRHYNVWFRRNLAPYLAAILLDARTLSRPYWNGHFLTKMIKDHVNGRRRYLSEIRKVLTIELVHRFLIEADA